MDIDVYYNSAIVADKFKAIDGIHSYNKELMEFVIVLDVHNTVLYTQHFFLSVLSMPWHREMRRKMLLCAANFIEANV